MQMTQLSSFPDPDCLIRIDMLNRCSRIWIQACPRSRKLEMTRLKSKEKCLSFLYFVNVLLAVEICFHPLAILRFLCTYHKQLQKRNWALAIGILFVLDTYFKIVMSWSFKNNMDSKHHCKLSLERLFI